MRILLNAQQYKWEKNVLAMLPSAICCKHILSTECLAEEIDLVTSAFEIILLKND